MAERAKKERFEDHLKVVEEAIRDLDSGKLPLEDSLERYERGIAALRKCYEVLAAAEKRLEELKQKEGMPGASG